MSLAQFALPPTRSVGQPNPPGDINSIVDCVTAYGAAFSIVNTSFAGGAFLDGVSDSTAAIQACMNAAATYGAAVFVPGGVIFRATQLTWNAGQIIQGVYSGTYPGDDAITTASIIARLADSNEDLFVIPDGTNYGRIADICIDGNKNNNTSGIGFNIQDGAEGQETQIHVERCFFSSNPGSNVYLGNNRRGNKITFGVFNYSGAGDGITVCGSDNLIMSNIVGSNARGGINLGSTISQNWAAFGSELNSTTTHVINNDIYQNLVGICIPESATRSVIIGNGIDRNSYQGITVYNGDCNTIVGNALHSNGQAANNTYGHIDLAAGVSGVCISDNTFGPIDGGITNLCSFCVVTESGIGNGVITGNIGNEDTADPDTVGGLISTAGSNTSPSVVLSKAGAIIQAANTTQAIIQARNSAGSILWEISGGGSFVIAESALQAEAQQNVIGSATAIADTTLTVVSNATGTQNLALQEEAGQTANLFTAYASNGSTVLQAMDYTGAMPGLYLGTPTRYAPSSQVTFSSTSATFSAISSANINSGSFTAPASGQVLVTATITSQVASDGTTAAFGLAAHGTTTPMVAPVSVIKYPASAMPFPMTIPFLVSTLTAGSAYTFDLMYCVASGGTVTTYAYGQSGTTPTQGTTGQGGPVVMTVQAG